METEIISTVAHELRAPLSIIKEACSLLLDEIPGPLNEKQKNVVSTATNNIKRLNHIINDLLEVSRIEQGTLRLRYSLVNLNDLLRDSQEYFTNTASRKDIRLSYSLPRKEINIFIDPERIHQVITNLITNAIKFTPKGGKIAIKVKYLKNKIRIGVIDTGIGIAKKDISILFDKFVQVSNMPGVDVKGLGLGLSIAKEFVEKHGGELSVESKIDKGSKFYFTLPCFYSINVLDKDLRNEINTYLENNVPVYLINVTIIHFRSLKRFTDIPQYKLLEDLHNIIKVILFPSRLTEKQCHILIDDKNGIFSIPFPEKSEKKVLNNCLILKDKMSDYFTNNKIKKALVNIGIHSYHPDGTPVTHKLDTNLCIKKITVGPELRRYKRIDCQMEIDILHSENKTDTTQTIDISEGGLCFTSKKPLKADSLINIGVEIPTSKKPIEIKGKIVWQKKIGKLTSRGYKVGLEFSHPIEKNLLKFIKSLP